MFIWQLSGKTCWIFVAFCAPSRHSRRFTTFWQNMLNICCIARSRSRHNRHNAKLSTHGCSSIMRIWGNWEVALGEIEFAGGGWEIEFACGRILLVGHMIESAIRAGQISMESKSFGSGAIANMNIVSGETFSFSLKHRLTRRQTNKLSCWRHHWQIDSQTTLQLQLCA